MKKYLFIALLVALGFGVISCDEDPLCFVAFTEGPYLNMSTNIENFLIVSYKNGEGVGESMRMGPENPIKVPIDAHSDRVLIQVYNRWGQGDSIEISYRTKVEECNDAFYLSLVDIEVSRDTNNNLFSYFPSYYEKEDLDYDGNSVDISNHRMWPVHQNFGVIIR